MTATEEELLKQIFKKAIAGGYKYPEDLPKDMPDNLRLHIVRSLVLSPKFLKAFFGTGEQRKDSLWYFKQTPEGRVMPNWQEGWIWHGIKMFQTTSHLLRYPADWLPKDENLKT